MKKLLAILLAAVTFTAHAQTSINGAGATFPAPVYSKWAAEYNKQTGVQINYQHIPVIQTHNYKTQI